MTPRAAAAAAAAATLAIVPRLEDARGQEGRAGPAAADSCCARGPRRHGDGAARPGLQDEGEQDHQEAAAQQAKQWMMVCLARCPRPWSAHWVGATRNGRHEQNVSTQQQQQQPPFSLPPHRVLRARSIDRAVAAGRKLQQEPRAAPVVDSRIEWGGERRGFRLNRAAIDRVTRARYPESRVAVRSIYPQLLLQQRASSPQQPTGLCLGPAR